jgi:hypothetical protein
MNICVFQVSSLNSGGDTLNNQIGHYQVVNLPPGRRLMINMLNLGELNHSMYGLLEVDVTIPRELIADHKARTGETLSFTGYLTYCLARAVDEDKTVQAYLKGSNQLAMFDDVDVGLMIERTIGEKRTLMGYTVRLANHKTYMEIHQEIRSVQSTSMPPNRGLPTWFRYAMLLPWPLSKLFNAFLETIMRRNPAIGVSLGGTVGISSVGMFSEGISGWGIFPVTQVLGLIAGSIVCKPAVVNGQIEPREILNLTVVFDHKLIDGAPATRFVRRLVELIESGHGLTEGENRTSVSNESNLRETVSSTSI